MFTMERLRPFIDILFLVACWLVGVTVLSSGVNENGLYVVFTWLLMSFLIILLRAWWVRLLILAMAVFFYVWPGDFERGDVISLRQKMWTLDQPLEVEFTMFDFAKLSDKCGKLETNLEVHGTGLRNLNVHANSAILSQPRRSKLYNLDLVSWEVHSPDFERFKVTLTSRRPISEEPVAKLYMGLEVSEGDLYPLAVFIRAQNENCQVLYHSNSYCAPNCLEQFTNSKPVSEL